MTTNERRVGYLQRAVLAVLTKSRREMTTDEIVWSFIERGRKYKPSEIERSLIAMRSRGFVDSSVPGSWSVPQHSAMP